MASLKLDEQEEFIQLLSQALGNNNFQVRYSAIVALLGLIDVASPDHQAETVGLLQKAISDRGWYQRLRIANDLPRLAQILAPQYHAEFMEILRKMVQDQDNSVRHCALHSLPKALQVLGTRDQIEIISLLSAALNDSAIDSRDFAKGKNIAAKILSEWTPTLESLPVEDLESFYQLSGNSETAGRIFGSIIRKKRLEKALTQGKAELSAPEENGVSARKQYGDLLGYSAQSTTHSLMLNNASGSSVAASPRSPALSLPASVVSGGHVFLRRFYWAFKALNGKLDAALGDYKNHPTNRKAEKILTLSEKKISAQGPTVSFLPLVAQTLGPNYSTEIWRIIKTTLENPRWPSEWRVVRELPALAQILGSNYYSEVMRLVTTHEATKSEVWVEIFLPLAQMLGPSYHVEIMNSLINLMRRSSPDVRNKATGNLPQLATILGPSYYAGFMEIIRERLKDPEWLARKYMAETLVKMTPVLGSSYHAEIMQLIQEILIDDDYIIRRDLARLLPKIRCIFKELPIEDLEVIAKNPRLHEIAKNFFDVMVFEKQFEKNILKTLTEGKPELPVDEERLGAESAQKRYGGILD